MNGTGGRHGNLPATVSWRLFPTSTPARGMAPPRRLRLTCRLPGGLRTTTLMGDIEGARQYLCALPYCNGKVGCFGTCWGGRHAVLAASRIDHFNAAIDCWGGGVVMSPEELTPNQPVAPIDYTIDLKCPLLGIFGEDGQAPGLAQVDQHEAELKKHRKTYEFYRYPNVGHHFYRL